MKRYRICSFSLDTTRNIFGQFTGEQTEKIKKEIKESLISKYGEYKFDEKFARYMALQKPAISVMAEHSYLLEDICDAYIQGNCYSALTGACCLGERMFNNIIFKVMNDFKSSFHYKSVYNKKSIIDWLKAINILSDWGLIDEETKIKYEELYKLRTDSVHFQKRDQDQFTMSLSAINAINFIIHKLFAVGPHRKDILIFFEVPGELFIKKEAEQNPIVKAFYLPCSVLVGPKHKVEFDANLGNFKYIDQECESKEISDSEFVRLRKSFNDKI